jgi:hypothetical protein
LQPRPEKDEGSDQLRLFWSSIQSTHFLPTHWSPTCRW